MDGQQQQIPTEQDVLAAREDLQRLKAELEAAVVECPEDEQLHEMLQEAALALKDAGVNAPDMTASQDAAPEKTGCKRQAAVNAEDSAARKVPRSVTSITAKASPNFLSLAAKHDYLRPYVTDHKGKGVLDFKDWSAVHALARAHLQEDFGVMEWSVPAGHLIPAIPNRLAYLLWISDLLHLSSRGSEPVRGLDIGCGGNLIYPLLGASIFDWHFTAVDTEECAIENACSILERNQRHKQLILLRHTKQCELSGTSPNAPPSRSSDDGTPSSACGSRKPPGPLRNSVHDDEEYDFCMCNPPFFTSTDHAKQNGKTDYGGTSAEMACLGGEEAFTMAMVNDSILLNDKVHWYTTMFGKKSTFKTVRKYVKSLQGVSAVRSLDLAPGRTVRWLLAWSFTVPREEASQALQGLALLPQGQQGSFE